MGKLHEAVPDCRDAALRSLSVAPQAEPGSNANRRTPFEAAKAKAEAGDRDAQFDLGVMYIIGMGVGRDSAEAAKWYRKAAEQGHANAQNNLGLMYMSGRGVAKDNAEAVKWLGKAAEQGYWNAQSNYARACSNLDKEHADSIDDE